MIVLRPFIRLPFLLNLQVGPLKTSVNGEEISIRDPGAANIADLTEDFLGTCIEARFSRDYKTDPTEIQQSKVDVAKQLLVRVNRVLRWYRVIENRPDVTELTLTQASPFTFQTAHHGTQVRESADLWRAPLIFHSVGPQAFATSAESITLLVAKRLGTSDEPDESLLLLLDAELALLQGRYREAVLLCWSTIDSVFTRKYEALAESVLQDEWSEARKAMIGIDFSLRNKMSVGMRFLANRSLFHEPDKLWDRLSRSYSKRNKIIHAGDGAVEADALLSIALAKDLLRIMSEITVPEPKEL